MKLSLLSYEENIASAFTHRWTIPYTDLTAAALTQTFQLYPSTGNLVVGTQVRMVGVRVGSLFAGPTTVVLDVGNSGAAGAYGNAIDVKGVTAGDWVLMFLNTTPASVGNYLTAKFTSTGTNVNTCTAGSLEVYFQILRENKIAG